MSLGLDLISPKNNPINFEEVTYLRNQASGVLSPWALVYSDKYTSSSPSCPPCCMLKIPSTITVDLGPLQRDSFTEHLYDDGEKTGKSLEFWLTRTLGAHKMVPSCELNIRYFFTRTSLVAQTVKSLPAIQETWVWSLGWKDPLEKEMSIYSSILAWRIPWTEEPGRLWGCKESDMTEQLILSLFTWQRSYFILPLRNSISAPIVVLSAQLSGAPTWLFYSNKIPEPDSPPFSFYLSLFSSAEHTRIALNPKALFYFSFSLDPWVQF